MRLAGRRRGRDGELGKIRSQEKGENRLTLTGDEQTLRSLLVLFGFMML